MNCKDCIFAKYGQVKRPMTPDGQVGCACDRLDTWLDKNEAYQTEGESYYELTKFCNMYRNHDWRKEVQEKHEDEFDPPNHSLLEDLVEIARSEVKPLFGIAVWDDPTGHFADLDKTVMGLTNIRYPRDKMKVVLSTFSARGVNDVADLINRLQGDIRNSSAIFHLLDYRKYKDTEVFKKLVEATFFVHIKSGTLLPEDLFELIDKSMNEDLERACMWEGDGFTVIHKKVVTGLYLQFNDYDKMVSHIREIAKEQNAYQKV